MNVSRVAAPARLRALGAKRAHRRAALLVGAALLAFLLALAAGQGIGARAGSPLGGDRVIDVAAPRISIPQLSVAGPLPELQVPVAPVLPFPPAPPSAVDPPADTTGEPSAGAPPAEAPGAPPAVPPEAWASNEHHEEGEVFEESVAPPPPAEEAPVEDPPAEEPAPEPTAEATPEATPAPQPAARAGARFRVAGRFSRPRA